MEEITRLCKIKCLGTTLIYITIERLQVGIPLGAWLFVFCHCRVLSGRGHCDGPITLLDEFYSMCVCMCASARARACARVRACVSGIECMCFIECNQMLFH